MEYLNLPMGYIYQWAAFGNPPNVYETVGASLMALTCFIELIEEVYEYRKEKLEALEIDSNDDNYYELMKEDSTKDSV